MISALQAQGRLIEAGAVEILGSPYPPPHHAHGTQQTGFVTVHGFAADGLEVGYYTPAVIDFMPDIVRFSPGRFWCDSLKIDLREATL